MANFRTQFRQISDQLFRTAPAIAEDRETPATDRDVADLKKLMAGIKTAPIKELHQAKGDRNQNQILRKVLVWVDAATKLASTKPYILCDAASNKLKHELENSHAFGENPQIRLSTGTYDAEYGGVAQDLTQSLTIKGDGDEIIVTEFEADPKSPISAHSLVINTKGINVCTREETYRDLS